MKALFPKSKAFQLVQAELLCSTVNGSVFEQDPTETSMIDCRLDDSATTEGIRVLGVFELPKVATLVMQQAWVVVALVEVFEDRGEYLGFSIILSDGKAMIISGNNLLIGQVHPLRSTLVELAFESGGKEWGQR